MRGILRKGSSCKIIFLAQFIEGAVFLFTLIAISLAVKKAVSMTPAAALGANN